MALVKKFKKLIFILLDGIQYDYFKNLLEKGKLPNIKKHLIDRGSFIPATSVFPSTTGPAFIPFIMGITPGEANIPGIRWMSKKDYLKHKYRSPGLCSYMGLDGIKFNQDLPSKTSTLFDYFDKTFNIYNLLTRGVKIDLTKKEKPFSYLYTYFSKNWNFIDRLATKHLIKTIKKDFDFIFCLYPGVDEYTHLYSLKSKKVEDELIKVDKDLGKVFNTLKEQSLYDETLFVVSSDHGITDTNTHIDLAKHLEKNGLKCLHFPIVWKKNVKCASMVSGNGMSNLYFKDKNNNWNSRIYTKDLRKEIKILLKLKGIDLIIGKKDKNIIEVINKIGSGKITYTKENISYSFKDKDPLEINKTFKNISYNESLDKTINTKYPDIFQQLIDIFKAQRSGDLIVSASEGYDLRARYEFHEHHATHGALTRKQMLVPFLINKKINKKYIRTIDSFALMLKLLGKKLKAKVDGEIYDL
jgi:predicted AlkP superfamily phosphohydrolase/phosphomutase